MVERGVGDAAAKFWAVAESGVGGEGAVACGRDCRDGDRRRGRPDPAARGDGLNDARRDDGWFRNVPGIFAAQTALQKDASIEIVWSVGWKLGGVLTAAHVAGIEGLQVPHTLWAAVFVAAEVGVT